MKLFDDDLPPIDGPGALFSSGQDEEFADLPPIEGEPLIITQSFDSRHACMGMDVDYELCDWRA